jgi:tight adherence protein C
MQLQAPVTERFFRPVMRGLASWARRFTPAGWIDSLARRLALAGSPRAWQLERVLSAKLVLGLIGLGLGIAWLAGYTFNAGSFSVAAGRFILAPLLVLVLYMLPDTLLILVGRERQQTIQLDLPDALDQMTISVEAGLGFEAALQRFAQTGSGPLAMELRRTLNEISIGVPRRQAFQNLLERTDVQELSHFVFSVNQAEQYGLPVANVLRVHARELRILRRQRAEERALKIPVKIVLPLVLCIFPALFVVILVPAMIRVFENLL